jgi:2-polyprenyl-3-methyl-5-hydroxy-6-metoxy-1,4-benzoquinol methylase
LIPEKLKNLLRGSRAPAPPPEKTPGGSRALFASRTLEAHDAVGTRNSRGLEQFFEYIRGQSGLTILDLGGAVQQNVNFITNLGHRLYSEDLLRILEESFGAEEDTSQSNPGRIEYFLRNALDYPEYHFDGVLIWDVLEYLEPALLAATVERLHKIVRPNSYMLAFFHSDDKLESVPYYCFRIQDMKTLQVAQSGTRQPAQLFNNRRLEKLFNTFGSVKFFLTRERLREVIVKS